MSKELFVEFVGVCFGGNRARAAAALECDRSLVTRICAGDRGITPVMAERIEALSDARYRKEWFIWPAADKKTKAA